MPVRPGSNSLSRDERRGNRGRDAVFGRHDVQRQGAGELIGLYGPERQASGERGLTQQLIRGEATARSRSGDRAFVVVAAGGSSVPRPRPGSRGRAARRGTWCAAGSRPRAAGRGAVLSAPARCPRETPPSPVPLAASSMGRASPRWHSRSPHGRRRRPPGAAARPPRAPRRRGGPPPTSVRRRPVARHRARRAPNSDSKAARSLTAARATGGSVLLVSRLRGPSCRGVSLAGRWPARVARSR